ncbi:kinetochore-associated Ndc80 complex subunit spc24 [Blyttiomyces sp. JEL0837]|nr:kinetochore-associated Ndc80 complex subunit spc24 [Blyttiomyces sp. JEL0837]
MMMIDNNSNKDTEDSGQLLTGLLKCLEPSNDIANLNEIDAYIAQTNEIRGRQLADALDVLKKTNRELETLKRQAIKAEHDRDEEGHKVRMSNFEAQKYVHARGLQDEEKIVESLESKRRELLNELAVVKLEEASEDNRPPDETILKLSVYKQLGIDTVEDENGKIVRCIVQSVGKNDITPLELNDEKYSSFFYANILWEMCST